MRRRLTSTLLVATSVAFLAGATRATQPVGVSPGTTRDFVTTADRCPTFSWGAVPAAKSYEILVFDMDNLALGAGALAGDRLEASAGAALRHQLPGTATSWTPDRESCLSEAGRYAWIVRAETPEGSDWSAPRLFRVAGADLEQREMEATVERVLARLIAEGRLSELQTLVVGETPSRSVAGRATAGAPQPTAPSATGDAAIRGELAETVTEVYGVQGVTNSGGTSAAGVLGEATAASGDTAGVRGINQSAEGAAGVFENTAGGPLLKGISASGESLLVDASGAITANAFILDCASASTFYRDGDEDTFGDPNRNAQACAAPSGYVSDGTDCDDEVSTINPGAAEAQGTAECTDGIDNDCDTLIDDLDGDCCGGALNTYYRDADEDNYGDPLVSVTTCAASPPTGFVENNNDCDDENSAINPEATEVCDGVDNDCDGQTDEGTSGAACDTGFPGVCAAGTETCNSGVPSCEQNVLASAETCDGLDNNCDGAVDEGNPSGGASCDTGLDGVCAAGTEVCVAGSIGCQQNVASTAEVCDGLDNDCNGVIDNGGDSLCNDADGCTIDSCTTGQCFNTAADCSDGLSCTDDLCTSTGEFSFTCSNPESGGELVCSAMCVDPQTNPNHCGACDSPCGLNQACSSASCVCQAGFDDCDGSPSSCETDLTSDSNNCLACGNSCNDGLECTIDVCTGSGCMNTASDPGTPCTGGTCDGAGNCVPD